LEPLMKLHHAYLFLTCFAVSPALAQASALVAASLGGVTVRPGDGSVSTGVSRSFGCASVLVKDGTLGSRVEYFGCEAAENKNRR
jgi:hypothetical protein